MTQYKNSVVTACLIHISINLISAGKEQSLLCYVHTIYQIIQKFLNIFSDSVSEEFSCFKDMHHEVYLLKYLMKTQRDARKKTGKIHDKSAIKSDYYKLAEGTPSLTSLTQVKIMNSIIANIGNISVRPVSANDEITSDDDSEKRNELNQFKTIKIMLTDNAADFNLPSLNSVARESLIEMLAERVMNILILVKSDSHSLSEKFLINVMIIEILSDMKMSTKDFWELNKQLNTASILSSDYETACKHLRLDPDNSVFGKIILQP